MCEKQLTLGSLFDGSGGVPLAGLLNGIRPVWASEVAPFPILVTAKRLPEVKHYGDISTLNGAELEPVDIITFGSPCTSLSVAGLRAGLEGKQSVLFFQAIRIIKEMREQTHGRYPRWICWENVFGVFSSGQGRDLQRVLEEIIGIVVPQATVPAPDGYRWPYADVYVGDGWSLAYRTVNAQWYGVPQRRRRCYLVADFGSERACDILFERDGVRRDFTQGFRAWENPAGNSTVGVGTPEPGTESVYCLNDQNITEDVSENRTLTLKAHSNGHQPCVLHSAGFCTEHSADSRSIGYAEEISPTLRAGVVPAALLPTAFGICSRYSEGMLSDNPHSGFYQAETSRTLDCGGGNPSRNQGGMAVVAVQGSMIGRADENGPQGSGIGKDVSFTLNTTDRHGVAYAMTTGCFAQVEEELAPTLQHRDYKDPPIVTEEKQSAQPILPTDIQYVIRRLTPTEAAALQGFPSWWCADLAIANPSEEQIAFWLEVWATYGRVTGKKKPKTRAQVIRWLAKPYTDGAAYSLWGNGIALPCAVFVLGGIAEAALDQA